MNYRSRQNSNRGITHCDSCSLSPSPRQTVTQVALLSYYLFFSIRGRSGSCPLVLRQGLTALEPGMVIGCSSARRVLQLKKLYPECIVKPVRGNIVTRIAKLDAGEFDALILAAS